MNKYKINLLSNKIPVLKVPVKGATTATVLIMVKTGSKYEERRFNGLSHFLEHMFFKGTKRRPDTLAISSELDALGGEYNAFTAKEFTGYWIKVAGNKLPLALDIISDMLLNSVFSPAEIDRERGVIIEEINMYEDNPLMHIEDVFESCLYGDSPAGRDTIGTKANIRRFKQRDFLEYLSRQYGSRSVHIVLSGNLQAVKGLMLESYFSAFTANPWQASVPTPYRQDRPKIKAVYKKIDQMNLSLGVRAFPIDHPEEFRVKLLALILGGSMSSRLFINLRERNGLAYYVRTLAEVYSDAGYLTTQAGVPRDKTTQALEIIMQEYRRLKTELVGQAELKRAKDLLQGRTLLQLEATDNLATWYGRQSLLRSRIFTPTAFFQRFKSIRAEDLRLTARKIFVNQGLNLALIGQSPAAKFKKSLKF